MTMGTDWGRGQLDLRRPAQRRNGLTTRRTVTVTYWSGPSSTRQARAGPIAVALPTGSHRIVAKGSGRTLHELARENLFDPLGSGPTEWADCQPRLNPTALRHATSSCPDCTS